MDLNQLAKDLVDALNRNAAALEALAASGNAPAAVAQAAAPAAAEPKTTRGKAKAAETKAPLKVTKAEVDAALVKLKDDFGLEHAKAAMGAHGVTKMAEIPEEKFEAIKKEAEALHAKLTAGEDGDEEGDDL